MGGNAPLQRVNSTHLYRPPISPTSLARRATAMKRSRAPVSLLVVAAVGAVALAAAVTATAAAPVVSLSLGARHAHRALACAPGSKPDPYAVVRRGVQVVIAGSIRPRPSARPWRVTIEVRRCVRGGFQKGWIRVVVGGAAGSFRVVYTPRTPGLYFARAYYKRRPTFQSGKLRFVVG
jgi:hypothetical protein